MTLNEMRQACERLLAQARDLLAAFPDGAALRGLTIDPLPAGDGWPALRAALRHMRDEMVLMWDGKAGGVVVLDDEVANVERLLAQI